MKYFFRWLLLFIVVTTLVLIGSAESTINAQVISTPYPAPGNLAGTSSAWDAWVDGQPAETWHYAHRDIVHFEFSDSATVKVRYNDGDITSARVMPSEYGIPVTIKGKTVTFTLNDNTKGKVVLRINNSVNSELFVLGEPPAPPVPKGAVEYSGTVNPSDHINLKSNTTYYFHANALVNASFIGNNIKNVKLIGPGVLSAPSNSGGTIEIHGGENIILDGIIVTSRKTKQATHNIYLRNNLKDITINNIKVISYNQSGDGLAIGGAVNVNVTNSFFNASDDNWNIGWSGLTANLLYKNNVCYFSDIDYSTTGQSGIIHIQGIDGKPGTAGNAKINNVTIKDTYVIGWDCGIIAANWGQNHWDYTKNFVVDGLWVEPDSRSLHHGASWRWAGVDLSMHPLFYTWDNASGPFLRGPQNIIVKNVYFDGYQINHTVVDKYWHVTFSNVHDSRGLITSVSQVDKSGDGTLIIDNSETTTRPPEK